MVGIDFISYVRDGPYHRYVREAYSGLGGRLAVARALQPPGHYPDPALNVVNIQILLSGSGRGEIDLGHGRWAGRTQPGQIFIASPNVQTDYVLDFTNEVLSIGVDADYLRDLGVRIGNPFDLPKAAPLSDPLFPRNAARLLAMARAGKSDLLVESMLIAMLWSLETAETESDRAFALDRKRLCDAEDYVTSHLESGVSVVDLANFFGVDRFKLARSFRSTIGMSPRGFIHRTRAATALRLLRRRDMSLSEIALATGFADQAHMTRSLKSITGRTPGGLRSDPVEIENMCGAQT